MKNADSHSFQHSGVGESSGSASGGDGRKEEPFEPFAGKLKPPSKAERRARGEIACAECRRLKIKCDRSVPCTTCVKRGCAALCPNGTIPPGEGSRFVLAATDHLRDKMSKLEARMRCLEDAISIIYTRHSDKPHPLLTEIHGDFLDDGDDEARDSKSDAAEARRSPGLGDPLGTLLVDARGGSRFFGPSGSSESLLMSQEVQLPSSPAENGPAVRELDPSYFPPSIVHCFQAFPLTPPNVPTESVQGAIGSYLPTLERAMALRDIFYQNLNWLCTIVPRQMLTDDLIRVIYKQAPSDYSPHELGVLFAVFALASLVDVSLPPCNAEAQHYHYLARASMALQPIIGQQSIWTVKAIHLMSLYNSMSGSEANLEQSYVLLDLACQVAVRIGLHVDPSSWGIQGSEAYLRRVYFWHLMSGVLWQSLITGRPPGLLTSSQVDCRVPSAEEGDAYEQEDLPDPHTIWGYRAASDCLIPVARAVLAVKPPGYDAVLELEEKVRQLPMSGTVTLQPHRPHTDNGFRIFSRSHYHELMLLFLHRAYFAQAMSENPGNPLNSPYGHSVRTAYSSACIILQDTREQYSKAPLICGRIWKIWSFTFTAAMIVGTVAIRGVHLPLDPPALQEFEAVCEMFNSAAQSSIRAALAVPLLKSMLQKARIADEGYRREGILSTNEFREELSVLSGHPSPALSASSRTTSPRAPQEVNRTPRQGETDFRYTSSPPITGGTWQSRPQSAPVVVSLQEDQGAMPGPHPLPGGFRLGGPQLQHTFVNLTGGTTWSDRARETPTHYDQPGPSYQVPVSPYQPQPLQYQPQASPAFAPLNIAATRLGEERPMVPRSTSNPQYGSGPGFQQQVLHPPPMQSASPVYHHQVDREYGVRHQPYPLPHRGSSSSTLEGGLAQEGEAHWVWQPAYPSPIPRRYDPQQ